MNVYVVYVYSGIAGQKYVDYAKRFVEQYKQCLPEFEHQTVVAINGLKLDDQIQGIFSGLPNLQFMEHDNSGYDIGAFQHAAREFPCDLMVFFGASTYFTKPGWLKRMVEAFARNGDGIYGTMGNRGNLNVKVWPHIRTTAFWMPPKLLNEYPKIVTEDKDRHSFEHGSACLTSWVISRGLKAIVVTWSSETEWEDWDSTLNGFQRGDQSDLLAGDHICEPPYYPKPRISVAKPLPIRPIRR